MSDFDFSYQNGNMGGNSDSAVSLNGLRKPKIDSWDSMGILGLTTKIWNDTQIGRTIKTRFRFSPCLDLT